MVDAFERANQLDDVERLRARFEQRLDRLRAPYNLVRQPGDVAGSPEPLGTLVAVDDHRRRGHRSSDETDVDAGEIQRARTPGGGPGARQPPQAQRWWRRAIQPVGCQ